MYCWWGEGAYSIVCSWKGSGIVCFLRHHLVFDILTNWYNLRIDSSSLASFPSLLDCWFSLENIMPEFPPSPPPPPEKKGPCVWTLHIRNMTSLEVKLQKEGEVVLGYNLDSVLLCH